mgnify:CR=1 FL=1
MDNETKKRINEKYEKSLNNGERFWPDSIYKDLVVSLGIFIVLILLATFVGVAGEPKADPADTSYIPRPEWYFLFLFKFLALYGQIPVIGKIEWIATVAIPSVYLLALLLLPFIEKSAVRHYSKRVVAICLMGIFVVSAITLTLIADIPTGTTLVGYLQTIGSLAIPTLANVILVYAAFKPGVFSNKVLINITVIACVLIVGFTAATMALYTPEEKTETAMAGSLVEQIQAGQDLYAVNCVECHGDDGKVTVISGVKGLEGKAIPAINSKDVLYTLNDASMAEVIAFGRPSGGMNPFGKAYNSQGLSRAEIDNLVIFMRYAWDDRFEMPKMQPLYPPLAEGEVPNYETHIAPIVKRYCVSCHRQGKDNNEFWMTSYQEIMTTGDNGPNVVAGDENSNLLQVIQGHSLMDGSTQLAGQMPPNKLLSNDIVQVFKAWVLGGMPEKATP